LQSRVSGQLRISTSVAFGRRVLTPLVLAFMRQHPDISIDLSFDDRYVNLVEQGVDVAVRMGRLADSSLGARYLGINPWVLVASPAYLKDHAAPKLPIEVAQHPCLVYSSVQGDERWQFTGKAGREESVPVHGPLRTNNLSVVLEATQRGMGLAILPWYVAHGAVQAKRILPLLTDFALPVQEMHAVFPSPKLVPSKVTTFISFLQERFTTEWWKI
jgi:DNA-binding transcriptional LysR family regulator